MGNYKFRLSDMMPNAWFYKLRDMSKARSHKTTSTHPARKKLPSQRPNLSRPRQSYYYTAAETETSIDKFCTSFSNPKSFDTHFPDPPRKSSKKKAKRKSVYKPSPKLVSTTTTSVSADCSCSATLNSVIWSKHTPALENQETSFSSAKSEFYNSVSPEFGPVMVEARDSFTEMASWSGSCSCRITASSTDIIIDMNGKSFSRKIENLGGFQIESNSIPELELPPILTKPMKPQAIESNPEEITEYRTNLHGRKEEEEEEAHGASLSIKIAKDQRKKTQKEETRTVNQIIKNTASHSTGIKLKANSPRIASKKIQARRSVSSNSGKSSKPQKKSFSESFAIVKSSFDPQTDFKDSMVEMIIENNIRASQDLEELLALYLSLNSDEYHDLIVKAFEQIWFDMADLRL